MALGLLQYMVRADVEADTICYSAAISACEKCGGWQKVLELLNTMEQVEVQMDAISYAAAIGACESSGRLTCGLELLEQSRQKGTTHTLSSPVWALARLAVRSPALIHAALVEATSQLSASRHPPGELSILAWAVGMLGIDDLELSGALAQQASAQIHQFKLQDLLLFAWGTASSTSHYELSYQIQEELACRLQSFQVNLGKEASWNDIAAVSLGVLWSYNAVKLLRRDFVSSARGALVQVGEALDSTTSYAVPTAKVEHQLQNRILKCCVEPIVVLELPDRLVVAKPPAWEVCDRHLELQIASFVRARSAFSWAILQDSHHHFGFLHRLDVPSSGFIVVAKTYQANYDLRVQLAVGEMARDYIALCHGRVPPLLCEIKTRVHWGDELPTNTGVLGRPSNTRLKVIAQVSRKDKAFSLVAIRIATGRRHQIRSHSLYVGHPTVCDGKYTAHATFQSDVGWCTQNFLHRYRVAFKDSVGCIHEVIQAVPTDLTSVLEQLSGINIESERTVHSLLCGLGPADWNDYASLTREGMNKHGFM